MAKTELIKLRCTPEEKAKWESEAEAQGVSISELARQRMNRPWTSPMKGVDPRTIIQDVQTAKAIQATMQPFHESHSVSTKPKHHPRCTCGVCQAKK